MVSSAGTSSSCPFMTSGGSTSGTCAADSDRHGKPAAPRSSPASRVLSLCFSQQSSVCAAEAPEGGPARRHHHRSVHSWNQHSVRLRGGSGPGGPGLDKLEVLNAAEVMTRTSTWFCQSLLQNLPEFCSVMEEKGKQFGSPSGDVTQNWRDFLHPY